MLNDIRVGGRVLRYFEAGTGEPLVLVHGFPLTPDIWEPQLQSPPDGWRVIAPCLRGFGAAATNARATSMDDYAADLQDLVAGLGLGRAVFGGLSMGGYVLFALYRRAPDIFRGLVLIDTRPQADTPEGRAARERMLDLVKAEGAAGVARDMLPKLVSDETRRNRPDVAERVKAIVVSNGGDGIEDALRAMMTRPDSTPLLARIRIPVLIVVGEADALTPVADSEAMNRQMPGSRLVVVPGAGHLSSLERPDVVNAELSQWLLELSEARS